MIANERQYRITKQQLARLKRVVRTFNLKEVSERVGSEILAAAELNALKSETSVLTDQIREYELLRSGQITQLKASNLEGLPSILIRARIAQGLTQRELAQLVGLKEQQIQRYESDQYAKASLQRLQMIAEALRLNITEIAELRSEPSREKNITKDRFDGSLFPVKEMYKRQWFEGYFGSLATACKQADILVWDFIKGANKRMPQAFHRKRVRSTSNVDEYALLAWECRVISLAAKMNLDRPYQRELIDDRWIAELVKESGKPDGPLCAKKKLGEVGIALVIEPHLERTHLDGAALLYDSKPVIGLTLRYDRLDNFWFVLLHELVHVIKHLSKSKLEGIFDDLDTAGTDSLEKETDLAAGEALIASEVWDCALPRYIRSPESVKEMARNLGISPAIIAGRIRHEANNYVILSELVGQGEVRKHFPEARFGN